jgi:hypothetical protein
MCDFGKASMTIRGFGVVSAVMSALLISGASPLLAQSPESSYKTVDATAAKPVRLSLHGAAHKSICEPGPLPRIRVIQSPSLGVLRVRRGTLTTSKIADCPKLKVPVQVVFYQARRGLVGVDHVVYEVVNQNGKIQKFEVTVNVKQSPAPPSGQEQQKI